MSGHEGEPISTLLDHGATSRAVGALERHGVKTVSDLLSLKEIELYRIKGFGKYSRENIIRTLNSMGLKLRPDEDYDIVYDTEQFEFEEVYHRRQNFIICRDNGRQFNLGDKVKITNSEELETCRFIHRVIYSCETHGALAEGYCIIGF